MTRPRTTRRSAFAPAAWALALFACTSLLATPAATYPIDASEQTGITRLEAYNLLQKPMLEQGRLKPGSLLGLNEVKLKLQNGFAMPKKDAELSKKLTALLGPDGGSYGVAVLDITDPANPRFIEHRSSMALNAGSVGKILVALGWFQALADRWPNDIPARIAFLQNTRIVANDFIVKDSHTVPFWKPGDDMLRSRPLEIGDESNLYTFLDWMCSASSNAAASMMMSELMLFVHFGEEYPVSPERAAAFFADTPKEELGALYVKVISDPVTRSGLNLGKFRQGKFFTRTGKARVPGLGSYATSRELMNYLVKMEEGKLVDPFSSLEIKRLLYLTDWRIRYASAPVLDDSAVYYKSGSLYSCKPEEGFECGKYMGNRLNYLASTTIVESFNANPAINYIAVVTSNVLKKNSSEAHQQLAADIHAMIQAIHAQPMAAGGATP
jgi:hypothetical protein